jgi:hypothetical protein
MRKEFDSVIGQSYARRQEVEKASFSKRKGRLLFEEVQGNCVRSSKLGSVFEDIEEEICSRKQKRLLPGDVDEDSCSRRSR